MNWLRPNKHGDRGLESHSRHGCLCAFILFMLSCEYVAALRTDTQSEVSLPTVYRIKKLKRKARVKRKSCRATDINNNNNITALVLNWFPVFCITLFFTSFASLHNSLESREYGSRDPLCWPRNTFYLQKLALTSPTSGGRLVGIVRTRTTGHAVCSFFFCFLPLYTIQQPILCSQMCQSNIHYGWLKAKFMAALGQCTWMTCSV
jgi:hypothetical protein